MKILYGVQGTGQGHISRARAMAEAMKAHPEVEVTWLFSGRERDKLFDMEPFGDYLYRRGLTFITRAGKINHIATAMGNNVWQFGRDVFALDTRPYDLLVTDFEPVIAWAARRQGRKCVGIGHQYAFGDNTPKEGDHFIARLIMRLFAPAATGLGLHWHPYHSNILPPIIDLPDVSPASGEYFLVYLPFEDQGTVTRWLAQQPQHQFVQYAPGLDVEQVGNVLRRPTSVTAFKEHLLGARGVICNTGFELISECLQLRKPVLTRPVGGQFEQLSNALALKQLSFAQIMYHLSSETLEHWLKTLPHPPTVSFHKVPEVIANWLAGGCVEPIENLSAQLWSKPSPSPQEAVFGNTVSA